MEKGDFVAVHLDMGCQIGKFISSEGDTVTVNLCTALGEIYMTGIPKERVTLYQSKRKEQ